MGQKVNPHGLRVGVIKDWDSRWYAEKDFADCLVEDHEIRTYLKKRLYSAGISKIEIERASDRVKIIVYTAKPGVVIGKGGSEIEKVKKELQKYTTKKLIAAIAMVTTVPVITTAVAIAITRVGICWRGHDGKRNNRRQCCFESATLKHDVDTLRGSTRLKNKIKLYPRQSHVVLFFCPYLISGGKRVAGRGRAIPLLRFDRRATAPR